MTRTSLFSAALLTVGLSQFASARPGHHPPPPPDQLLVIQGDHLQLGREAGWRKEVVIDASTQFFEGRQADPSVRQKLRPGDGLRIRDKVQSDGSYLVEELHRENSPPVRGRLIHYNSNSFQVDNHGELVQVDVTSATRYFYGCLPGSVMGLGEGSHVLVEGKPVGANHIEASEVHMPFPWFALAAGLGLSGAAAVAVRRRRRAAKRE